MDRTNRCKHDVYTEGREVPIGTEWICTQKATGLPDIPRSHIRCDGPCPLFEKRDGIYDVAASYRLATVLAAGISNPQEMAEHWLGQAYGVTAQELATARQRQVWWRKG